MSIPLRKFNQAYGRQSGEDTIIDLTIALEKLSFVEYEERTAYIGCRREEPPCLPV